MQGIGISPMICSDIIQQLLDENLMFKKIGSANYYWCFESKVFCQFSAFFFYFWIEGTRFECKDTTHW